MKKTISDGGAQRFGPTLSVLLLAGLVAGCQSSAPAPQQTARSVSPTAPADLQLLCASAAAQQLGADPNRVLPVSSRRLDATSYLVELNAGGQATNCIVDDNGIVLSVGAV